MVKETVKELSCYTSVVSQQCENQSRMKEEGRRRGGGRLWDTVLGWDKGCQRE